MCPRIKVSEINPVSIMTITRRSNKYVARITLTSQNCTISGVEVHEDGIERQYSSLELEQLLLSDSRELELFIADETISLDKLVEIVKRLVPLGDHVYVTDVTPQTGKKIAVIMITRRLTQQHWNNSTDRISPPKN